jgi:hypothetical protein
MNKVQTLVIVVATASVAAVCAVLAPQPSHAADVTGSHTALLRPLDDGEPVGISQDPLGKGEPFEVDVTGHGTVQGSGFNCAAKCSQSFGKGDTIKLTAQEANGYRLSSWDPICGGSPPPHSCSFTAGDVRRIYVTFVPLTPVSVLKVTSTSGVKDGRTMRRIDVLFDVGASSVVTYELRQSSTSPVLRSWKSSPFTGRSTRSVWLDDGISTGTYDLRFRIATGSQVRSFHTGVALSSPQP